MQKAILLLIVFLGLLGASVANRDHNRDIHATTLNRALRAALSEIIQAGEYEAIMNKWLGQGNYEIPTCEGKWPTVKRDGQGGPNSKRAYYDMRDILLRGQIRFAGSVNDVFAQTGDSSRIISGVEYDLGVAIARRISMHYGVFVESNIQNVVEEGDIKFPALASALYLGFPTEDYFNNDIPHEYDAILGSLAYSPVRNRVVDFVGCSYFLTYLTAIRTGYEPLVIVNTVEDLQKEGVLTAVLAGSSGHQFAIAVLPASNYIVVSNGAEMYNLVANGPVHAALAPAWQVDQFLEESGCDVCSATGINLSTENYALATRYVSSAFSLAVSMMSAVIALAVFLF